MTALENGDGLAIVVNASAGSDRSDDIIGDLNKHFAGSDIISVADDSPLEAAFARAASAKALGIVGGDGSINAAAEEALATGRPLAVFPGGTLNHFARDIGVSGAEETISAVRRGELVSVDVGLIDGKPFLNTASFGNYAEFVDEREKLERRLGKWLAMLIAIVKVLWHATPVPVELDGQRRSVWMIFIGNCEYQPPGLAPSSRAHLDDGYFDVRYFDGSRRWSRTRLLGAVAFGRLARAKVYTRALVRSLDVHSLDGPLRLARDGETFDGGVDVQITKHAERLAVYAPHGNDA